jgi:hypothetical protein
MDFLDFLDTAKNRSPCMKENDYHIRVSCIKTDICIYFHQPRPAIKKTRLKYKHTSIHLGKLFLAVSKKSIKSIPNISFSVGRSRRSVLNPWTYLRIFNFSPLVLSFYGHHGHRLIYVSRHTSVSRNHAYSYIHTKNQQRYTDRNWGVCTFVTLVLRNKVFCIDIDRQKN